MVVVAVVAAVVVAVVVMVAVVVVIVVVVTEPVQVLGELVQNAEQRELLRAMLARDKER